MISEICLNSVEVTPFTLLVLRVCTSDGTVVTCGLYFLLLSFVFHLSSSTVIPYLHITQQVMVCVIFSLCHIIFLNCFVFVLKLVIHYNY